MDNRQVVITIIIETRNHNTGGIIYDFGTFNSSITQIITNAKANVNITLFEFGWKSTADWNKSNGISETIPKAIRFKRYLNLFPVLKKPSTRKNIKIGNATLPKISNTSLTYLKNPFSVSKGYIKALFTWSINIDKKAIYFNCAPEKILILLNLLFP